MKIHLICSKHGCNGESFKEVTLVGDDEGMATVRCNGCGTTQQVLELTPIVEEEMLDDKIKVQQVIDLNSIDITGINCEEPKEKEGIEKAYTEILETIGEVEESDIENEMGISDYVCLVKRNLTQIRVLLEGLIQGIAFSRMDSFEDGKKKEIDSFVESFPTVEDVMEEIEFFCDEGDIEDILEFICERIGLVPLTEKLKRVSTGAKFKIKCKCGNEITTNANIVDCRNCGRVFTMIIDNEPKKKRRNTRKGGK